MCLRLALVVVAVTLLAGAQAQAVFPYTKCQQEPKYYRVSSVFSTPSPGEYCFTIKVNKPASCNATDYCCSADLRKFEIEVNPECNASGLKLAATLNGVKTTSGPIINRFTSNGANATLLRLTNLGLDMDTANGAVLCLQLGVNSLGQGCLTLEALCKPPNGGRRGNCNTVMFDSKFDCCPVDDVTPETPTKLPTLPCNCDNNQGVTPFSVKSTYTTTTTASGSTVNCFTLAASNKTLSNACGPTNTLLKAEIIADQSLSSYVRTITLQPKSGSAVTLRPSWNGPGTTNVLKATPINWSTAQADGGEICVEIKAGKTMKEMCGGTECSLLLFNSNKKCCPQYTASGN